jgi:membrane-associated phospholipid phosphatase
MDGHSHANPRPPRPDRRREGRGGARRANDALYSTLRFIGRHVRGFWSAILAFLGLGLSAASVATVLFALVATAVEVGFTEQVDARVVRWFAEGRTPLMDLVMLEITTLGNGLVLTVLVGTVSLFLWLTGHHWSVYILVVGVVGGMILNNVLKGLFARPRPDMIEPVSEVLTLSFPSGHAMSAVIAYGAVALLVARLEPTAALRRATWITAAVVVLAIGVSRIYLGVHYPSDVLAGFVAGIAWLAFVAASVRAVHFYAPRRPATALEERGLRHRR